MAETWNRILRLLFLLCCLASACATDFQIPNSTLTRLGFGSCHKNKYANTEHNIWKTIQDKSNPQLWLWTGDAVYGSRGVASLDELRGQYQQMKENETIGYKTFHPPLGIFGTWDDHDYGGNDAGHELPDKEARADLFREFIGRVDPDPSRQGLYSSLTVGVHPNQVKIILLDTRWHREEHCIPSVAMKMPLGAGFACLTRWLSAGLGWCSSYSATMLGEEQWKWLESEVSFSKEHAPALTLVVSSVQVLTTNPTMEGWGHFPRERDRLIRLLGGLVDYTSAYVLSGDVHHAEILDPLAAKEDTFLEVTSSGLTHDCSKHIYGMLCKPLLDTFSDHRFKTHNNYYIGTNYGMVNIDWEGQKVDIEILDDQGKRVLRTGPRTLRTPHTSWSEEDFQLIHPAIDGHLLVWCKSALLAILVSFALFGISKRHPANN